MIRPMLVMLMLMVLCPLQGWAAPGAADLFTRDYSTKSGNWDGWGGDIEDTTYVTQERVAAGGPHSLDAFQVTYVGQSATSSPDPNQPNIGHYKTLTHFSGTTSRFFRWYQYEDAGNDYRPADGGGDHVLKRMIVGPSGGNRMILNIDCNNPGSAGTALPHLEVIFDGGTVGSSGTFSKGVWHAIQVEVRFNGASSYIKVWLDTDTYASPTIDYTPGSTPSNSNTSIVELGRYSNDTVLTGGQRIMRDAAFRVATTFDSNWYGWLQNGDGGSSPRFSPAFLRRVSQEVEP